MSRCFFNIKDCKSCVGASEPNRLNSIKTTLKLFTREDIYLERLRRSNSLSSIEERLVIMNGGFTFANGITISRVTSGQSIHSLEEHSRKAHTSCRKQIELQDLPKEILAVTLFHVPPESQTSFRLLCPRIHDVFIQAKRAYIYNCFDQEYALEY
jgi:hypothetical protein